MKASPVSVPATVKRDLHLSALRGFLDRMVNRHVCILNPASSVKGVKELLSVLEASV